MSLILVTKTCRISQFIDTKDRIVKLYCASTPSECYKLTDKGTLNTDCFLKV